jgi:hypothetical protein
MTVVNFPFITLGRQFKQMAVRVAEIEAAAAQPLRGRLGFALPASAD